MKNNVFNGFLWKLLERFGVSGIQFVLQIILARLLSPEHYGALSIMIIFTNLANIFVQSGFNTALIQKRDIEEEDYSSVLWVSFLIAVVLYGIIFLASPWIGEFYNMPDIGNPMRVLALMLIPGAINSVQLAKISRELDFKKVFYSNIWGALVSGIISIVIALMGGGLWSLVAQSLINVVTVCIVMRFTVKLKIRLEINWKRIKVLFSFGWKLLGSALMDTLYTELNSLVIGKKYDSGTLGYFNRGKQFPQYISGAVNGAVQSVMLPAMSANQDNLAKVKTMMRTSLSACAYIMFPVMFGLASVSGSLVRLLLTEKWLSCVPYMMFFCFEYAFYPVHSCNLQAINALGRSDIFLKLEIIKKAYGIVVLAIAVFCFDSPIAIAAIGLFTTWIGWFVNSYPNKKLLNYSFKEQIKDLLPTLLMAGVMFVGVYAIGQLKISGLLSLVIQVLSGIVIYLILSVVVKPEPYRFITRQIINKLHN